jgi:hypothetical protein
MHAGGQRAASEAKASGLLEQVLRGERLVWAPPGSWSPGMTSSSASARFAVLAAFWEDLSKVTLLRLVALVLDAFLTLAAGYSEWLHWYREVQSATLGWIGPAARSAHVTLPKALALWFVGSLVLVPIYRIFSDILGVGPRSLLRRGFHIPASGWSVTVLRNLPGAALLAPPTRSDASVPLPEKRSILPLLAVLMVSFVFNTLVIVAGPAD